MNFRKMAAGMALVSAALAPVYSHAAANVTPLWLRDVMISPDGQQIAFCYKGDSASEIRKGSRCTCSWYHDYSKLGNYPGPYYHLWNSSYWLPPIQRRISGEHPVRARCSSTEYTCRGCKGRRCTA